MKRRDKTEKKKKIMIGIILTVFLISSVASVVLFYQPQSAINKFTLTYDIDYTFNRRQDNFGNIFFEVFSDKGDFIVYNIPEQLAFINSEALSIIQNTPFFYFTFDPDKSELTVIDFLRFDLRNNLPETKYFQDSITNSSKTYNLPIVTCQNATLQMPVVVMVNATEINITAVDNCVKIEFPAYEILRVRDLLIYSIYGIKNG